MFYLLRCNELARVEHMNILRIRSHWILKTVTRFRCSFKYSEKYVQLTNVLWNLIRLTRKIFSPTFVALSFMIRRCRVFQQRWKMDSFNDVGNIIREHFNAYVWMMQFDSTFDFLLISVVTLWVSRYEMKSATAMNFADWLILPEMIFFNFHCIRSKMFRR